METWIVSVAFDNEVEAENKEEARQRAIDILMHMDPWELKEYIIEQAHDPLDVIRLSELEEVAGGES